jgi:imidazolonepropionase-like amidohydrolase
MDRWYTVLNRGTRVGRIALGSLLLSLFCLAATAHTKREAGREHVDFGVRKLASALPLARLDAPRMYCMRRRRGCLAATSRLVESGGEPPHSKRGIVDSKGTKEDALALKRETLVSHPHEAQSGVVAIHAGKIIPISGPEIANGVILVRDGKIAAVGANVAVPAGATVLEASVVMPGMVEAHSARGMDAPNENIPVVPFVNTADGLDPLSVAFEDALRDGITTIHVIPGNFTVVGGTGVIVKPTGSTLEAILVRRPSGMKLSLSPTNTRNRMAQFQELRRAFDDFDNYMEQLAERRAEQKKKGEPEEEMDPKQQAMADLKAGKFPAYVYCPSDADVPRAIDFIEARRLKTILVLGPECYKTAPLIARKKLPVILDPQIVVWESDEDHEKEIRHVTPVAFQQAGVRYAFQVAPTTYGARYLWYQAATAVSYGVPRADALRAITLTPAEILGLSDRIGSIQVGKDANLLLLTGDPLESRTWVDTVLIEGKVVYERKNDAHLQKLLTGK